MSGAISFVVYGVAAPAGSKTGFYNKRSGRVHVVDACVRTKPWQAEVKDKAIEAMKGRPLIGGPVVLEVAVTILRPKGHIGARGLRPSAPKYPTVRPDLLKLARAIEDALTGTIYRDDAQIVSESLSKRYGEPVRVEVRIREAA